MNELDKKEINRFKAEPQLISIKIPLYLTLG